MGIGDWSLTVGPWGPDTVVRRVEGVWVVVGSVLSDGVREWVKPKGRIHRTSSGEVYVS